MKLNSSNFRAIQWSRTGHSRESSYLRSDRDRFLQTARIPRRSSYDCDKTTRRRTAQACCRSRRYAYRYARDTIFAIRSENNWRGRCRNPFEETKGARCRRWKPRGVEPQHIIRGHVDKSAGVRKSERSGETSTVATRVCLSVGDERYTLSLRSTSVDK